MSPAAAASPSPAPGGSAAISDSTADRDINQYINSTIIKEQILSAQPAVRDALHQLPAAPADFTGRVEELRTLTNAIRSAPPTASLGAVLTGINGMGGVGKTALALRLAHDLIDDYSDAQFFLDLRGAMDAGLGLEPVPPEQALQHVLRAFLGLDAKLPDDLPTLQAAFHSLLTDFISKGKRILILWDNARDAEQVRPLMPPPGRGCLVLVTSRRSITLPGMKTTRVDQLPLHDARELLRAIARNAGRTLTDEQADPIAELCGRLPQALRLAGGALASRRDLAPDDLARRLADIDERLKVLDAYKDDSGERSLRASMEMTEALLPEQVRSKWHMLAVCPGDFEAFAAAAVWGEVTQTTTTEEDAKAMEAARSTLSDLTVFNALEFDEQKKRHKLHDLVRSFLLDRIAHAQPPSEEAAVVRRFVEHYTGFAAFADHVLEKEGKYVAGLALFDAEWPNIRAAFALATARAGEYTWADEAITRLANECIFCLDLRLHGMSKVRWLTAGLQAARRLKNREAEGVALGNLGIAYRQFGDVRKTIEYHTQALAVSREIGAWRAEGYDLGNLGNAYLTLGNTRKAIEFYEQSLVLIREIGDRRGEGSALGSLGNAHLDLGDTRKAIDFFEQVLTIMREVGDRRGVGDTLGNLGIVHARLGDTRKAIEFYEQRLVIAREIGDRGGEADTSWNMGMLLARQGRHAEAAERMQVLVDYYTEIKHPDAAKCRAAVERIRAGGAV
jgi:tetratricopeptide (TPR) repeat protein